MSGAPKDVRPVDALVIGGGFYGCCIALLLKGQLDDVVLVEKERDLLQRASSLNQARVHTGYHYPRSLVTAYRSLINFPRFVLDFRRCIVDDFTKLYAVARHGSKVNALRFHKMFKEMGAPIEPASPTHKALFTPELIEDVFQVREVAFDAVALKNILRERLDDAKTELSLGTEAVRLSQADDGAVLAEMSDGSALKAKHVFLCAYSRINYLLAASRLPRLPMKQEVAEMALVALPRELAKVSVTVMDGPFFSIMPYPSRGLHTLSHVRYTPHMSWTDGERVVDGHAFLREHRPASNYVYMQRDAQRYMPALADISHVDSLFEIKTVLVKNEVDDGRPILFRQDHGLKNLHVVMGGKIDNIYDIIEMIAEAKTSLGLSPSILGRLFKRPPA